MTVDRRAGAGDHDRGVRRGSGETRPLRGQRARPQAEGWRRSCGARRPSCGTRASSCARAGWTITRRYPAGAGLSSSAALERRLCLALCELAGVGAGRRSSSRACARASRANGPAPRPGCSIRSRRCCGERRPGRPDRHPRRPAAVDRRSSCGALSPRRTRLRRVTRPSAIRLQRAPRRMPRGLPRRSGSSAARRRAARAGLPEPSTSACATCSRRTSASISRSPRSARGTCDALGELLDASHASLRDPTRCRCPRSSGRWRPAGNAGAAGARIMGGGFGGSVLACSGLWAQLPPGAGSA